ncbi:hypothetical protein D6833_01815, partial [Candidatus Parcubacteria bacterium]
MNGYQPPDYDAGTQSTLCGADSSMTIGCLKLKLTRLNYAPLTTRTSDNSYQPGLYSVNIKDRPVFQFSNPLPMGTTWEGTLITTWDADPADGDQTGEEIFFMDWIRPAAYPPSAAEPTLVKLLRSTPSVFAHRSYSYACAALSRAPCISIQIRSLASTPGTLPDVETDAQGNVINRVRPTVTVQDVATLTNDSGVQVSPASVNVRKNPDTNTYVDADITSKQISITVPGDMFNRADERWIEIRQGLPAPSTPDSDQELAGATIRKA